MNQNQEISSNRGTVLWGVNRLRSDALVALLDDLTVQERNGISDSQCNQVKIALGFLVNSATAIPDENGWWRTTIWQELQEFLEIYEKWNSHSGNGDESVKRRRIALKKLRGKRNRIATKIRKHQFIIQSELDLKLVESMYDALGKLAKAFPDVFVQLGAAVSRFRQGIDKKDE